MAFRDGAWLREEEGRSTARLLSDGILDVRPAQVPRPTLDHSAGPAGDERETGADVGVPFVFTLMPSETLTSLCFRAMLTAYDYPSALAHRSAKVDISLIGDSLANVALGHPTTQQLDIDAMVHHCAAVSRGVNDPILSHPSLPPTPLIIADLPFGIAQLPLEAAVPAALDVVRKGRLHGLKIEGGREVIPLISHLTSFGTAVMAHIGLQPQRFSSASALSLQARTAVEAIELLDEALALEEAGAFAMLIECVPGRVAAEVTKRLKIPTIGIGAGKGTDGQVLVQDDILGEINSPLSLLRILEAQEQGGESPSSSLLPKPSAPTTPRFVRNFAMQATGTTAGAVRVAAVQAYVKAVKERTYPNDEEGYKMKREEWAALKSWLEEFDQQEAATAAAEEGRQSADEVIV